VLPEGTRVAALVPDNSNKNISGSSDEQLTTSGDESYSWILAELKQYDAARAVYTVEDIDIEEGKE